MSQFRDEWQLSREFVGDAEVDCEPYLATVIERHARSQGHKPTGAPRFAWVDAGHSWIVRGVVELEEPEAM